MIYALFLVALAFINAVSFLFLMEAAGIAASAGGLGGPILLIFILGFNGLMLLGGIVGAVWLCIKYRNVRKPQNALAITLAIISQVAFLAVVYEEFHSISTEAENKYPSSIKKSNRSS